MASITLQKIVKDYDGLRAVHGVDLGIEDGEFVAFVGPSGCGKSTLLRMIAGLEEITSGSLQIGERTVNQLEPRDRNVAMVFQDYALYPHMSVARNMGFGLKMRGTDKAEIDLRVQEAATMLQIDHLLERKPGALSGGQRQRVAMGRAIVRKPAVFLFDEPLSNLDAKLRVDMRIQIKRLHSLLKTTTVYVTHDQVEAMTLADRMVILREGRIEQQGRPIEIYQSPCNRFVAEFIGSPQMNILNGVLVDDGRNLAVSIGESRLRIGSLTRNKAGDEVLVGIRPEHLAMVDGPNTLHCTVDLIEPTGADTTIMSRVNGQDFSARIPADYPVQPGEHLSFSVAPERIHLFDRETLVRVEHAPI